MAQSFYIRLLTLVDDYGRFDADLMVLKSYAFPLDEKMTTKIIDSLCAELSATGLVIFFTTQNVKRILQLEKWDDKPRSKPKYEGFSSLCMQLYTTADKCSSPSPSPSPSPSGQNGPGFENFWKAYPKKKKKLDAQKAWKKLSPNAELEDKIMEAVGVHSRTMDWRKEDGQFIPYPASWLNGRRWEDDLMTGKAVRITNKPKTYQDLVEGEKNAVQKG